MRRRPTRDVLRSGVCRRHVPSPPTCTSTNQQSGCGNTRQASERLPQAPALLPLYVNELAGVAAATGYPQYHVLGDGWGGMLAATAAAAGRLPGAVSLTLLNTPPSYAAWIEDRRRRVRVRCFDTSTPCTHDVQSASAAHPCIALCVALVHRTTCRHITLACPQALQLPGSAGQDLLAADSGSATLLQGGTAAAQAYLANVVCHRAGSSCLFNSLQETAVPVAQQLSGGYMFKVCFCVGGCQRLRLVMTTMYAACGDAC